MPEAPALVIEKQRLNSIRPGQFLGIIGDASHTYGYHLENPPASDYSRAGVLNNPVGNYACAIDIGMNWPASRDWLSWFIAEVREDRISGIAEVIGSFNGRDVRYWSDSSTPQWQQNGVAYQGSGHDTWTHVAVYRSTALTDHRILAGWTANGLGGGSTPPPPGGGTVANQYDPIKDVLLFNTPQGTRLGDVWGNTLGKATTAADQSYAANLGVQQLLSRPAGAAELSPEQINAIIDGVADRVGGLIAKAVADELAARLSPDTP